MDSSDLKRGREAALPAGVEGENGGGHARRPWSSPELPVKAISGTNRHTTGTKRERRSRRSYLARRWKPRRIVDGVRLDAAAENGNGG